MSDKEYWQTRAVQWEADYREADNVARNLRENVKTLEAELAKYKTALAQAKEQTNLLTGYVNEASYKGGENCDPRDLPDVPALLDEIKLCAVNLQYITKGEGEQPQVFDLSLPQQLSDAFRILEEYPRIEAEDAAEWNDVKDQVRALIDMLD